MNKCYLVSYDLRKARNYQALYDALKSYPSWAKILESMWAVVTPQSAAQVHAYLAQHIDDDDGLFVVKSGRESAWTKVNCTDKWLHDNL